MTRVLVIGGGENCEHDVSVASAAAACRALRTQPRYDVIPLTIGPDGVWYGANRRPLAASRAESLSRALRVMASSDVVLPMVHGPRGEDGTLAALCELAGVPYVGSNVRSGALAMDKWTTKLIAASLGIRVAAGEVVTTTNLPFPGPVVVKPVAAGSSHGVTLVRSESQWQSALRTALSLDDRALVEQVQHGREVDIAVMQRPDGSLLVGPTLEIGSPAGEIFDTTRKYDGTATFVIPARIPQIRTKEIEAAATAMFTALGCSGVARFDFFVDADGVVLNEVNTIPGFTEQSQVPRMFASIGISYEALLCELVDGALRVARPEPLGATLRA